MAIEQREVVRSVHNNGIERQERVLEHTPSTQSVIVSRISKFMWFIAAVLVVLLTFRFILKLIAANPGSDFVSLIYRLTDTLVAPFAGIIQQPALADGAMIDIAALFAMTVFTLVIWGLVYLFRIVFAAPHSTRRITHVESLR